MLSIAGVWDVRGKWKKRLEQDEKYHKELRLYSEGNRRPRKGFKDNKVCILETEFCSED